jgi:hypothetical protein
MKLSGKNKKIAIAYIKAITPIGTEIFDPVRSGSFIIRKNSVFEAYSDLDDMAEPNQEFEGYEFLVHNPGKYEPNYHIKYVNKRWVIDYYNKYIK